MKLLQDPVCDDGETTIRSLTQKRKSQQLSPDDQLGIAHLNTQSVCKE